MEARIVGVLGRSEHGCLGIETGGGFTLLLFPYGTTLSQDGGGAKVPGLGEKRLGDEIDGGGGYISTDDVPEQCHPGEELAAWQTID